MKGIERGSEREREGEREEEGEGRREVEGERDTEREGGSENRGLEAGVKVEPSLGHMVKRCDRDIIHGYWIAAPLIGHTATPFFPTPSASLPILFPPCPEKPSRRHATKYMP